jgi:hypothetical protein
MGWNLSPELRARCRGSMPAGDATSPAATKPVRAKRGTGKAARRKQANVRAVVESRVEGDVLILPIRVTTESNTGGNKAKIGRRRTQRFVTGAGLRLMKRINGGVPPFPARVTFTRVRPAGRRALDTDNLCSAFKAVRDEVAAFYGVDDGDPRWDWQYPPEVVGARYEIRIRIEAVAHGR